MKWPDRVQVIVNTLHDRHPELANGSDDQRSQLTQLIAEQVAYEFGSAWGRKKRDSLSPLSVDTIAELQANGHLLVWDWQDGTTRAAFQFPEAEDLTTAQFVAVPAVDHLGVSQSPAPQPQPTQAPTPPPASTPADPVDDLLERLVEGLDRIYDGMAGIAEGLNALDKRLAALEQSGVRFHL